MGPSRRTTAQQLLALFLLLAGSIAAITWRYHVAEAAAFERQVENRLLTITDSTAKQLSQAISLRLGEARSLLENRMVLSAAERMASGKASPAEASAVKEWLSASCRELHYANAILTDRHGTPIASAGRTLGNAAHLRELASAVISSGSIQGRDFHNEPGVGTHLGLNVPLRLSPALPVFGALLIAIDPADNLYPLLNAWPDPSEKGEILLVRKDGGEALVLNELRLRPGSAMHLRISMSHKEIPAVAALNGREGILNGRDSDGSSVLAAARAVPGTAWQLVAQIGREELFAPLVRRSLTLAILALSLVLAAGGGVFLLLRRQEIQFEKVRLGARAELERSEARFRSVVENAPEGIIVLSGMAYRYLNPAAVRMLGAASGEELIGRLALDDVHPDERESAAERIRLAQDSHATPAVERRMLRRDGTEFLVEVMAVPAEHEGQQAAMAFFRDITEHNRLEEQLRQAQKMESVGRLAGGVAHDFNNILTVINGYSEMLLEDPATAEGLKPAVHEILAAGERAALLTRQLLAFSRMQRAEPKPLDLSALVEQEAAMLRRLIGEDVEIVIRAGPGPHHVLADRSQLQQVLMNLTVNARDAMPGGGTITIETSREDLDAAPADAPDITPGLHEVLSVSDTGTGMTPEVLERIFEPFFTTKPVGAGTGLGLSTVYGIVRQARGFIRVTSRPGEGSTFRVYLPHTDQVTEDSAACENVEASADSGETVLVVEDQNDVRRLACEVLRRHGYRVLEAGNGAEALEVCARNGKDVALVLADVVMPGMSGPELAARLSKSHPGLRVLFTTGYAPDALASQFAGGPHGFLRKPFTKQELLRRVREELDADPNPPNILVVDDDEAVRGILAESLRGAGFRVQEACNGKQAMRLVAEHQFDLVITDIVMPEQEGLETIRIFRETHPALPVVAMSGAFGGAYLKAARLLGAKSLLTKPVRRDELLAVAREFTHRN